MWIYYVALHEVPIIGPSTAILSYVAGAAPLSKIRSWSPFPWLVPTTTPCAHRLRPLLQPALNMFHPPGGSAFHRFFRTIRSVSSVLSSNAHLLADCEPCVFSHPPTPGTALLAPETVDVPALRSDSQLEIHRQQVCSLANALQEQYTKCLKRTRKTYSTMYSRQLSCLSDRIRAISQKLISSWNSLCLRASLPAEVTVIDTGTYVYSRHLRPQFDFTVPPARRAIYEALSANLELIRGGTAPQARLENGNHFLTVSRL